MQEKLRIIAVVVAAVVLAVGTWIAYDKYSRRNHVIAMTRDAGARLVAVVEANVTDAPNADLEANATAIEGHAATLRRMDTASITPTVDAADDYLVTAREIARRSVEMQRARRAMQASLPALSAHISNDRGAAAWPAEALRLKETLDRDFRGYRMAVEAYRTLLGALPASQARAAPHIEGLPIVDDDRVKQASAAALDAYFAAEQNVKQVADLGNYAGRR